MTPLVSCVLTGFNAAGFVERALASIRRQTYRPLELIYVDSGSSDDTVAIVRRNAPQARIVELDDASPPATRNCGVRAARAPLVALLDADDAWHPEKTMRQVVHLETHRACDGCVTVVRTIVEPGIDESRVALDAPRVTQPVAGYATTTLIVRRSVFDRIGFFDETLWYADSLDWFLRARRAKARIDLLDDTLLDRHLRLGSITIRHAARSRDEFLGVLKSSLDRRAQATVSADMTARQP